MQRAPAQIGVCIIGAGGYMGRKAVELFPELAKSARSRGTSMSMVSVAETSQSKHADLKQLLRALDLHSVPIVETGAECIRTAIEFSKAPHHRQKPPVIVFDASPTPLHFGHLVSLQELARSLPIYYFGEKPLLTDISQLDFIDASRERQNFFCEFIETESPTLLESLAILESEGLNIERMWFWRASCHAPECIAVGYGRGGVSGGALLDKSPHDISISVGLLGAENIRSARVTRSKIHRFALHSEGFATASQVFLGWDNEPIILETLEGHEMPELPVDALSSFDVHWELSSGKTVPASYIASWIGCQETEAEHALRGLLNELGVKESEWLDIQEVAAQKDIRCGCTLHEVRLAALKCAGGGGVVHLVLNFLSKFKVRRFVYKIDSSGRERTFLDRRSETYDDKKHHDLFSVFLQVLNDCAGIGKASRVGSRAALLTHRVLLEAREKAYADISGDIAHAHADSHRAYSKYVHFSPK